MSDPNQPTHVTVTVYGARELYNTNLVHSMNPYCIVTMGCHQHQTQVDVRGGTTPRWHQTFRMQYAGERIMRFKLMDKDKVTKDDLIAIGDVALEPIVYGSRLLNTELEVVPLMRPLAQGGIADARVPLCTGFYLWRIFCNSLLTRGEKKAGYLRVTVEFDPRTKDTSKKTDTPKTTETTTTPAPAVAPTPVVVAAQPPQYQPPAYGAAPPYVPPPTPYPAPAPAPAYAAPVSQPYAPAPYGAPPVPYGGVPQAYGAPAPVPTPTPAPYYPPPYHQYRPA